MKGYLRRNKQGAQIILIAKKPIEHLFKDYYL